jgi:hypothetical protein
MPHSECQAYETRLRSTESEADPVGEICPVCGSLVELADDRDEIVGYRAIETRGSRSHGGASRVAQLIADRVGEISARRERKRTRIRLEIESCDAQSASPQVQSRYFRAPGMGDEPVRRRRRAPPTAAPPGLASVPQAFDAGVIGANGAARRKFKLRPRRAMRRRAPV